MRELKKNGGKAEKDDLSEGGGGVWGEQVPSVELRSRYLPR